MGSTRLPGKSLMLLAGQPLLARVLERLQRCQRPAAIVLATPARPEDDALERIWRTSADPRNREHPHTNVYEHLSDYRIGTVQCPAAFRRPDLMLDVNTRQEYEFLAALYAYLYPRNPRFTILDVIRWYDD